MIVDSSALIAILNNEPDGSDYLALLADGGRIGAPTLLECAIVLDRRTGLAPSRLEALLEALGVSVVPFTADHARVARAAYARFGRGSGHPARLNFGDALAYAVAVVAAEPLLFKGEGLAHTDVVDARAERHG